MNERLEFLLEQKKDLTSRLTNQIIQLLTIFIKCLAISMLIVVLLQYLTKTSPNIWIIVAVSIISNLILYRKLIKILYYGFLILQYTNCLISNEKSGNPERSTVREMKLFVKLNLINFELMMDMDPRDLINIMEKEGKIVQLTEEEFKKLLQKGVFINAEKSDDEEKDG